MSDTTQHAFNVNEQRITYTIAGNPSAPAVIFIHGWTFYAGVWREVIDALKTDYYCIAIDLLGHGDSEIPTQGDYSVEAQAYRVLALADFLGLQRFALMGHSLGGKIALYIAAVLAPDRVIQLINVAGTVTPRLTNQAELIIVQGGKMTYYVPWLLALSRFGFQYRMLAQPFIGWLWFYDINNVAAWYWREGVKYAYQKGMQHTIVRTIHMALHSLDLSPQLAAISCPTLTIVGKQDRIVPVSDSRLVKSMVEGSELVIFDGCGHFPFAEKQSEFLAEIGSFLAARTNSSAARCRNGLI